MITDGAGADRGHPDRPSRGREGLLVLLLAIAIPLLWARFDSRNAGVPDFFLWKAVSGKSHGGQHAVIDGVRLYYETFGAGPPVLVLHGGKGFLETMHYPITALAHDHFVIAPDSRGHGRSSDGPGPLHYDDMARDMIVLMDRLHIPRADIVGWSDGGIIALKLAIAYPKRVRRIVAIGANFDVDGLAGLGPPPGPRDPGLGPARDIYRLISPTPDHWPVVWRKVDRMWRTEPHIPVSDLRTIQAPTLIIAGEHDIIRRDHTDAMAAAIPGAREIIISGAGHDSPLAAPGIIDSAILAFLGRNSPRPSQRAS
jgi:pimeloyl-ACP methyl ester carboxylesterase